MRSDEFIKKILKIAQDDEKFEELRKGTPLGVDVIEDIVLSQKYTGALAFRHTCVAGVKRTSFIRRLLITLSCLYEKEEACFLIISPKTEYGELLRLRNMDATVPYILTKEDLDNAKNTLVELLQMRKTLKACPKLFVVLDGLETLPNCNKDGGLEEYREIFELVTRQENIELITSVDIVKTIFSGYPGAFVGIGNCLVATQEEGLADVTYVNSDASLSQPLPIKFPDSPSITETIVFLNSLPKE